MPNTILHKRASTAGVTPAASSLALGELAINTADGKVFTKKADGTVLTLANTDNLSQFAATTSAQLAGVISDETGTGLLVFNTSPVFATSLVTNSTTFGLFNTNANTVTAFGAATNLTLAATTGSTTIQNNLSVTGTITGRLTNIPEIGFTGGSAAPIKIRALNDSLDTISFEGSAGQLFSVNNNLTSGSIFSVNDVSGIPSLDVNADGTVSIATFAGNVGIGTTSPQQKLDVRGGLDVVGTVRSYGSGTSGAQDSTAGFLVDVPTTYTGAWARGFNWKIGSSTAMLGLLGNAQTPSTLFLGHGASPWSGTDSIYLTAGGNVGVGISNPAAKLHVYVAGDDANIAANIGFQLAAPWMLIGDRGAGRTFTNGIGIKFHDGGVQHYSVGQINGNFLIAQTGSNGEQLFPSGTSTVGFLLDSSGNVAIGKTSASSKLDVTGTVTATAFSGPLTGAVTGNASTATTLQTARSINGTSFNGSADITTANWGTTRTLWGKSVNGSQNISGGLIVSNTNTEADYLAIQRTTSTNEEVRHFLTDASYTLKYTNDESSSALLFNFINTDTETGGGAAASNHTVSFTAGVAGVSLTLPGTSTVTATNFSGNAATATKLATGRTIGMTGDVTWTSASFDGSANVSGGATLANSGVTAGTYTKLTVDAKGRATSGTTLASSDIPNLDAAKITTGTIDAARLPSYVDDVLEYANLAAFPATGETGKIYIALDTNKTYRWSGSAYIYITSGAVDSVAGKTGVVTLAKADVGLGNVDNTADVNKAVASAGKWTTARSITIGATSNNVDGSGNVSWTLDNIGAVGLTPERTLSITTANWVTIATCSTGRAFGEFYVYDSDSSRHNAVKIVASTSFGQNKLAVIAGNRYSTRTIAHARILYNTSDRTYGGAKLQIYCENPTFTLRVRKVLTNQIVSWTAWDDVTPIAEGTPSGWAQDDKARLDDITNSDWSFVGTLLGNAASATKLTSGKTIGMTGDVSWTSSAFDGSGNVTGAATLANTAVSPGTYDYATITVDSKGRITAAASGTSPVPNNGTLTLNVSGTGLSGSQTFTANQSSDAVFTVTSNATDANTGGAIVARDTNGNFSAGTITAALSGNASSATTATAANSVTAADTRNVTTTPETINRGVIFDFKANTSNALSDGGTYHGLMTFRQYGSGTDWSGGRSHQLGFTDNGNLHHRSGTSTTWGAWAQIYETDDATTTNTINKLVLRDGLGNFSASTATLTGLTVDTDTLHVDSTNDRVGIGTTSPSNKLHVIQSGTTAGISVSGGTNPHLRATNGTIITKLQVLDGTRGEIGVETNHALALSTNNAARVLITNTGDVGVGVTSPAAKLDVNGVVKGTGFTGIRTQDLGSGTANADTYLRGDLTWQKIVSWQLDGQDADYSYNTGNVIILDEGFATNTYP